MPKPIKKRVIKKGVTEKEVLTFYEILINYYENNRRFVHLMIGAIVILIALVLIVIYSFRSKANEAHEIFYEGYKLYSGLYEKDKDSRESLKEALERFQEAYKKKKSAQTLYFIANTYYKLDQYKEALKTLDRLIKEFDNEKEITSMAYIKKATILLKQDKKQAALKVFNELYALKDNPYFKDVALYEASRILESIGRNDEAKKKLEILVKEFPASPYRAYAESKIKPKEEEKAQKEKQNKTETKKDTSKEKPIQEGTQNKTDNR
ncbi:MAG: tetratricopeptide repeat protein [Nitrospirae bacterium]|nr:tetratricopeptide repeat protein [Nitrospirota bacterium]